MCYDSYLVFSGDLGHKIFKEESLAIKMDTQINFFIILSYK